MKKQIQITTIAILMLTAISNGYSQTSDTAKYLSELMYSLEKTAGDRKKAVSLHKKALSQHLKKNYTASEKLWYMAAKADPVWDATYYNLACSTALQGKKDEAIDYIELSLRVATDKALKKRLKAIKSDSDLKSLRGLKSYQVLVKEYEAVLSLLKDSKKNFDLAEHVSSELKKGEFQIIKDTGDAETSFNTTLTFNKNSVVYETELHVFVQGIHRKTKEKGTYKISGNTLIVKMAKHKFRLSWNKILKGYIDDDNHKYYLKLYLKRNLKSISFSIDSCSIRETESEDSDYLAERYGYFCE